ncbi:MAG: phage major capsid protein [Castellaniella sp.]|nr:phage major capsid protein [Castellaniella sp.]
METVSRVWSTMTIKAVDEDAREIRGIASTPSTDRMGDVVDPHGAQFKLPIQLLWQHDHDQPIGQVVSAKVTDAGIEIVAKLAKIDAPARLAARLEEAWASIKSGLVRGLSIGFRAIEYSYIDGTDGVRFSKWEWYELSAVTIPANAEASITNIKQFSEQAASGQDARNQVPASGLKSVKLSNPERGTTMNYQEMLKRLEATKSEKEQARDDLQKTVSDEGRTKTAAEREAFDTLNDEIKAIDLEMKDLRDLEAQNKAAAKPVDGGQAPDQAKQYSGIVIKQAPEKLEKGIEFARFAMCLGSAKGDLHTAMFIAQKRFPKMERLNEVMKAAVSAGTTTDADWAGNLVAYNEITSDFVDYLRPRTIIGRFGQGGVPALRSIPFNVHIKGQSAASTAGWTGEGKHKPVTSGKYTDVHLGWAKITAISVATDELLRFSNPSAERLIRDDLANAVIERMDTDFIQIANAGLTNVKPASITYHFNGTATTIPAGTASPEGDIAALWSIADSGNLDASSAVYITTPAIARKLAGLVTAADNKRFPNMGPMGGTIDGVQVLVSNYVDTNAFMLAFAGEIWLADDGVVTLDASRETSLIMDSDPEAAIAAADPGATPPVYAPQSVSMFQTNSVAFRAERYINWQTRRANVVKAVSGSSWA